jgi:threonine aldolase
MHFFSDNATPVCPPILAAIVAADKPDHGYDGDAWSARLDGAFSDLFETPARALWIATGTAANSIALACLCPPYGGVICHEEAHIAIDECGAPGFYTHGAVLMALQGEGAKLAPEAVAARIARSGPGIHQSPARALSLTQATEYGLVYTVEEVAALADVAHAQGLGVHMDGARFANAVAHLGCAPADLTWRAGVDILSFGCVKNGGMIGEALVFFGPQTGRTSLLQGPLSGGPDTGDGRGRPVAEQCARRQCGGAGAGRGCCRPPDVSRPGQRAVRATERGRGRGAACARLRLL